MDPIDDMLSAVLEAPEAEWGARLESLCAQHHDAAPELRRRFAVLRRFGIADDEASAVAETLPRRFGDLELLQRLGSGGMGVVYLARDLHLDREVAVKLVRPEQLWFAGASERFRREVTVIAALDHPSIVSVHATGTVDGVPFLVMERVVGVSLAEVIRRLGDREPADLCGADLARLLGDQAIDTATFARSWVEVCLRIAHGIAMALAHAHARDVVHRDVKPSNVMLTAAGRVVLLDFGLAHAPSTDRMTRTGAQVGSLPYMSPEQVRGDHGAVGAPADLYSLGVLLYELLTLRSPHEAAAAEQTRRNILEGTRAAVRTRNRLVSLDLANVLDKALDVDPRRRYQRAVDFARDLDAVLHDRDVSARTPQAWLRAARWCRRNPGWAVGLVLGVLLIGGVPTGTALGIASQRGRALEAERLARASAYTANLAAAQSAHDAGDAATAKRRLDACAEDLRGWEWHHLRLSLDGSLMTLVGATQPIGAVAVAADLSCVASGGEQGEVCVWGLPSGTLRYRDSSFGVAVRSVRILADGRSVLVAGVGGALRRVNWTSAMVETELPASPDFAAVAMAPDGSRVWRTEGGWNVTELDPKSLQPLRSIPLNHEGLAPGERFLCTANRLLDPRGDQALLWDLDSGRTCARGVRFEPRATCAAVDGSGTRAAIGGRSGRIRLLDLATGATVRDLSAGTAHVRAIAFTGDGSALVTVAADRALRVFDLAEGTLMTTLHGHESDVRCIASAGSRGLVATGSTDGSVRLWSGFAGRHLAELTLHCGEIQRLAVDPDGRRLLTASRDGRARVWDVDRERQGPSLSGHGHWANCADFTPDGAQALTTFHNKITWHDLDSGRKIGQTMLSDTDGRFVLNARFVGGSDRVIVTTNLGAVVLWSLSRGLEHRFPGHRRLARALDLTPDQSRAVTGCDAGRICVWDLVGQRHLRTLNEAGAAVPAVRVRRSGRDVVCAEGEMLRIRDLESGAPLVEARLSAIVQAVDETADGQRIVAGLADGWVLLLRPEDGSVLWRLQVHSGPVKSIACDPHGRWIATAGADARVVILWRERGALPSILDEGHFLMGQAALRIELQLARESNIASALRRLAARTEIDEPLQARVRALLEDRGDYAFHTNAALFAGALDRDSQRSGVLDESAALIAKEYADGTASIALWHLRRDRPGDALAMADRLLAADPNWRQNWGFALLPIRAIALAQLGRTEAARTALAEARSSNHGVDDEYRAALAQLLSEAEAALAPR